VGSGAAECPTTRDPASQYGRLWSCHTSCGSGPPPPSMGGLRSCYAFRGSGPHLSAQEGSEVAMRPMALDPASQLGASRNTRVLRATRIKNSLGYAATLTPYQAVHTSYQDVIRQGRHHGPAKRAAGGTLNTSETCGQAATEPLWCSATPLTTPDVPLQCG
jgi:hypothetical protein